MTEEAIKQLLQDYTLSGWTPIQQKLPLEFYKEWLSSGMNADMTYLETHLETKEKPSKLLHSVQSVISVAQNYYPHPKTHDSTNKETRIALYARGADYHHWFQEKINQTIVKLKERFPGEEFIGFSDSSPVLERSWAYYSGLGWIGKNSCLINEKKGSLFVIGEIYTTLSLEASRPTAQDRCGTCTRCIDICPTDALVEPKKLDARKCISYWTIEAKAPPGEEMREKIGDWLFGCDLCQTVCPWNQKAFEIKDVHDKPQANLKKISKELQWILKSSHRQLLKHFHGTPLVRAGGKGLKRNAIIVATNLRLNELLPGILKLETNPYFYELCQWSREQFAIDASSNS